MSGASPPGAPSAPSSAKPKSPSAMRMRRPPFRRVPRPRTATPAVGGGDHTPDLVGGQSRLVGIARRFLEAHRQISRSVVVWVPLVACPPVPQASAGTGGQATSGTRPVLQRLPDTGD